MDANWVMSEARRMCMEDHQRVIEANGVLAPTKNKDPVNPPWTTIEYEAMEHDTAKYFLYYTAILAALKSIKIKFEGLQNTVSQEVEDIEIHCMVIGAGRGRLVDYCVDCLKGIGIRGKIHVLEANVTLFEFLKERFRDTASVVVHSPIVIRTEEELRLAIDLKMCDSKLQELAVTKPVSLFISELFGSFGDNEFVSEIISAAVTMFGKEQNMSIPKSYTTYLCAVSSNELEKYFENLDQVRMYLLGLPKDTLILSELHSVYSNECTRNSGELSGTIKFDLVDNYTLNNISGFAGYFRAELFEEIYIDTRPTLQQNTYFWETAFFPLKKEIRLSPMMRDFNEIVLQFKRICTSNKKLAKPDLLNIESPVVTMTYILSLLNIHPDRSSAVDEATCNIHSLLL